MAKILALALLLVLGHSFTPITITWAQFKTKYNKTYPSIDDETAHQQTFDKNLQRINEHNADTSASYSMDVNAFSDLSDDQFKSMFGLHTIPASEKAQAVPFVSSGKIGAPAELDWRASGKVTSVKTQGYCGACWAFTAAAVSQSHLSISTGNNYDLSEEALIECTEQSSCSGGYYVMAFDRLTQKGGLPTESEYPYKAYYTSSGSPSTPGICSAGVVGVANKYNMYTDVSVNQMKELLTKQPVAVAILAETGFSSYKTGVYKCTTPNAASLLNHGVTVVGYTSDGNYIIKNSWGTSWGDYGFGIISSDPSSDCGISATVFQLFSKIYSTAWMLLVLVLILVLS